ncbi:MAG TPA: type II toxin-antitoxin system RelE/ParE family toxin [Acidimicrobiales bacterium]
MYRLRVSPRCERGLRAARLADARTHRRLVDAIRRLADDPRPDLATKLTAFDPPAWRMRVGDHRVVYEVHDREVVVVGVNAAPRSEVYR